MKNQHQQPSNYFLGLDAAANGFSFETQSTLSVEDFCQDADRSVASSTSFDHRPTYVSPPTSTYSHSNAGDFCGTNQYHTSGNTYLWGCHAALSDYATSTDGQEPSFIDPRIFSEDFVQQSHIDVPPTGGPPTEGPSNYDLQSLFTGVTMPAEDFSVPINPPLEGTPEIRVEGMESWLYDTYHAGDNTRRQQLPPHGVAPFPQPTHLNVPYRSQTEPDDDQRSDSSFNTSHTGQSGHSCPECMRPFQNRDDLRRHRRYHDPNKRHRCRNCGKKFVHPKDLRRHQRTHDSSNQHRIECPVDDCPTVIGRLDNLKRHITKQHPDFDVDACHLFSG